MDLWNVHEANRASRERAFGGSAGEVGRLGQGNGLPCESTSGNSTPGRPDVEATDSTDSVTEQPTFRGYGHK